MTKAELDSKHLAELHALAAEAGIERYRMLPRAELVEKLSDGKPATGGGAPKRERAPRESAPKRERPPRRRRERPAKDAEAQKPDAPKPSAESEPEPESKAEPAAVAAESGPDRPRRKRRRRRFGRKGKGLRVHDLLLPPPGRQALVYGESRASCTSLLREVAGELAGADSKGPDPIALLIDPSPEELADWKREAPQAELVAAGQARHASDALAQASRRAESGEDVILLVDSLSRLEDADLAKEIFDGGLGASTSGSLTVVAAIEHS
jgi:hypothetical protein